ncbi:MAG: ATP-dependent RecD-like DNA helicase [Oscillospiraceae bacterium]|nr:ATP-dependent RecD-like DNA helicase [Oscillospiraceae bacterium]
MAEKETIKLSGTVETIVFRNEDTGFTVLDLAVDDELVTVVGEVLDIAEGEEVTVTGSYTTHGTYGMQFKAEIYERVMPATEGAIKKYLTSGAVRGIGPVLAGRLVKKFGDKTLEIMENDPDRLAEVQGISPKKAREIGEAFRGLYGIRTAMVFLSGLGIDPAASIRIWKMWGTMTTQVVQENPYRLCCEQIGLEFEEADEIAGRMGIAEDSPLRVQAALGHVLRRNAQNGHTCVPREKLVPITTQFLQCETELVEDELEGELEDGSLYLLDGEWGECIYLPELFFAENYIAGRINLMLATQNPYPPDYHKSVELLEQTLGITYAARQRSAVAQALSHNLFILTGGPGTGKTTTMAGILELLEQQGLKVALAAPTGRAAKRLAEVTHREARTIHRLLEIDPASPSHGFKHNEKNPLRCDAVIVDEMSMVDTLLFESLLRALKMSCKLILVGDPDQLPSVGAGNLLRDLIASERVATVHLDEIFRQAANSLIVTNAHAIVRGELPELDAKESDCFFLARSGMESAAATVADLVSRRLPASYGYSPIADIQVLCPGRKGALGVEELNRRLQAVLNPADPQKGETAFMGRVFREGDKVMQIKNNYDIVWKSGDAQGMGVFNGDIGVIDMLDRGSKTLRVRFDDKTALYSFEMLDQLEHAYAVTIHKSQGCEFEAVIMPLWGSHRRLHYRNLLYTGVTRARRILVMVGEKTTVAAMVENNARTSRYTNLRYMVENRMGI